MTSVPFVRSTFVYLVLLLAAVQHSQTHSDTTHNKNRYLAHLFHKYGSHGTISFEVTFFGSSFIPLEMFTDSLIERMADTKKMVITMMKAH